jgi:diaminopimelate epimerase
MAGAMRIPFTKMHGLGNDFVVLDTRGGDLPSLDASTVRGIADRNTGIGFDQLVILEPSDSADFAMRIVNSDGSPAEACGNAARAVSVLHGAPATIETAGGTIDARPDASGAVVDMGQPRFDWDAIPLDYPMDTLHMPVGWEDLRDPLAVNVGNPHVVFFVDKIDDVNLARLGPQIETDPLFPQKVNVNIAQVTSRDAMILRVWERGAGLTRACGTGACASAIAAMRRDLADRRVTVSLPGGDIGIEWTEAGRILMTGPARIAFRGEFDPADYS